MVVPYHSTELFEDMEVQWPSFFRATWTHSPDGYDTIPFAAYASAFMTTGTATLVNGVVCASGQPTDLEAF